MALKLEFYPKLLYTNGGAREIDIKFVVSGLKEGIPRKGIETFQRGLPNYLTAY